jgi:hypothetical protein
VSDKPAPEKLSAAGVLDRLLAYASSPWKAAFVIIGAIICGLGYVLYLERSSIADAILHGANERVELDSAAFLRGADRLLRDTRADYALLVEMHLEDNIMIDRVGIDQDGNRWVPSNGPQQALVPESSMPIVVRFLDNEVTCADAAQTFNEDMRAMAAKGYTRVCIVAVPPILGVEVGGLALAWKQALSPAAEAKAKLAMKTAALKFATW